MPSALRRLALWPARPLLRLVAEVRLALVDADVARYYVNDGTLSDPLGHNGDCSEVRPGEYDAPDERYGGRALRRRRLAAVEALEAADGRDPHPTLTRPVTDGQARAMRKARQDG